MSKDGLHPPDGNRSSESELSCEEALSRVYEYLDGELDAGQHDAVRRHIQKCLRCYPHFDFERIFLDYVHELGAVEESRPGLEDRIREMLAAVTD